MAQLDPDQYLRLTPPVTYGQDDGLFYDQTGSNLVLVIGDNIVAAFDTNGAMDAGALEGAELVFSSEARGDIIRYGSSGWERVSGKTSGQILVGDGTDIVSVAISGATLSSSGALSGVLRASLQQDDAAEYVVPLEGMRVHDALATALPTTAADDDMGYIPGTFGTDAPMLQGVDFGGTASDEKCRFLFRLPPEYVDGETITLFCRAGILTTVADGALTLDAEVYLQDGDGAVGSDICATAATDINSLTLGDKSFVITPTGVVAGDVLDIRLSFAGSDTGDLGAMIPVITKVSMLLDIKG